MKKMKLASKIAVIISVLLTLIFVILISFTLVTTQSAIKKSISSELNAVSKSNGHQVQQVFDTAESSAKDMVAYLQDAYVISAEGKRNMAGEAFATPNMTAQEKRTSTSMIYKTKMTELSADVEKYITQTARHAAVENSDIVGIGAMFEPYKFDTNIKDYAFYVSEDIGDKDIEPYGEYAAYSNENFYKLAKDSKKISYTEPYDFNGITMVSIAVPILYNDEVQGVIMADVNVSNFNKVDAKSAEYPSMYATIFDMDGTLIYDSDDLANVGKSMEEFFQNKDEYETVLAYFQKGESFQLETTRENGSKVARFYNPIAAGDTYWWTLTALNTSDMNETATLTALWLIGISIVSLVIMVFVVIYVVKRLLNPIKNVVAAANQISNGHFDIDLKANTQDEIGELTETFNNTAQTLKEVVSDISRVLNSLADSNLDVDTAANYVGDLEQIDHSMHNIISNFNSVVGNINQSSDQVANGADQVSSGAQALSQGATEQASSIQELSATIAEISAHIKNNAENAHEASKKASSVGEEAVESNRRMQDMLKAMDDISGSSSEIGKIIKTIEDIAFQTNILALNAAVEAARAGEAGKGFAVVADEVRNLATKSSEASKNTSVLIETSLHAVENGTHIASDTAKSLESVVNGIKEVSGTVDKISEVSKEQSQSIAQVTTGVDQISSVVQTNSATAEESAASSEELSGQAQILKGLISKFKLRSGSTGTAVSSSSAPSSSYGYEEIDSGMEEEPAQSFEDAPFRGFQSDKY